MAKRVLLACLVLVLLSSSAAATDGSALEFFNHFYPELQYPFGKPVTIFDAITKEYEHLSGPVKSVRCEVSKMVKGKDGKPVEGPRKFSYSLTYNPKGRLTEKQAYNEDAKANNIYYFGYADDGTTLIKGAYYNPLGDKNFNPLMEGTFKKIPNWTYYRYDQGNVEGVYYSENNDDQNGYHNFYSFDESGRLEVWKYREGDSSDYLYVYFYDGNGRMVDRSEYQYTKNGYKFTNHTFFAYDDKGWLALMKDYSESLDPWEPPLVTYAYDTNGNVTINTHSESHGGSGMSFSTYSKTYDKKGNLIEYEETEGMGGTLGSSESHYRQKFIYTFDAHGNWIKKVTTEEAEEGGKWKTVAVDYRTILYY